MDLVASRKPLTMDRAAFLLIRIKRAFHKKRNKGQPPPQTTPIKKKPPLLRARTLPAIITPSLNIIQAPIKNKQDESPRPSDSHRGSTSSRSNSRWILNVEDDDVCSLSPSISPRHSLSSTGSGASQYSLGAKLHKLESVSRLSKITKLLTKDKGDKSRSSTPTPEWSFKSRLRRRTASMDSLLAISSVSLDTLPEPFYMYNSTLNVPGTKGLPNSPSIPAKLEAYKKGLPHSPSVPSKLSKGAIDLAVQSPIELLLDGVPVVITDRRKLDKNNKLGYDCKALFWAVETRRIEWVRHILKSSFLDINSTNPDGFAPLDIAIMTRDMSLARLLQTYGARESVTFRTTDSRTNHLHTLVCNADKCIEEFSVCLVNATSSFSYALIKEKERQMNLWKKRHQLLKKMRCNYAKLRAPCDPRFVILEVVGSRAIRIRFGPTGSDPESIVTSYKIEWSRYEDFRSLAGSKEIPVLEKQEVTIQELAPNTSYFFRVAAGNSKGYSVFKISNPSFASPSSWRDIDGRKSRALGRVSQLDDLYQLILRNRTEYTADRRGHFDSKESNQVPKRHVRKSIRNLFAPAPKFLKNVKRAVYFCSILYTNEKVIGISEDMLPLIELEETYPPTLLHDMYWLMKISCTWDDVRNLRLDLEKSQSSSNTHLRVKFLQVVEIVQAATGIQDLGQVFYKPIRDKELDFTVVCTARKFTETRHLNSISLRWSSLRKVENRGANEKSATGRFLSKIKEVIAYNQLSFCSIPRGLYLGYVKMHSSVSVLRMVVPKLAPNVLPYQLVRDNPHISHEEWVWFKAMGNLQANPIIPSPMQLKFHKILCSSLRTLLDKLEVPQKHVNSHRFYDVEVIELTPDITFLIVMPPVDLVCSAPGNKVILKPEYMYIPVQVFEMIHMTTYQNHFISRYARLSSILESDTEMALHDLRQAFMSFEMEGAKLRLQSLQVFQGQLERLWRSMRWILDVIAYARDKQFAGEAELSNIWSIDYDSLLLSPYQSSLNEVESSRSTPAADFLGIPLRLSNSNLSASCIEIRRCASTSKLESTLKSNEPIYYDNAKSVSSEALNVSGGGIAIITNCPSDEIDLQGIKDALNNEDISETFYSNENAHEDNVSLSGSLISISSDVSHICICVDEESGLPFQTSVKLALENVITTRDIIDKVIESVNQSAVIQGIETISDEQKQGLCVFSVDEVEEHCFVDDEQLPREMIQKSSYRYFIRKRPEDKANEASG